MEKILPDLIEALRMSLTLPWYAALPVYGSVYAVFLLLAAKAYKAWRDALKK